MEHIEKYANTIRVFQWHRTHREICELCSRISLASIEKYANCVLVFASHGTFREIHTPTQFAYFTGTKHMEKYANCVGVFHSQGTYREIREHNSRISLAHNIFSSDTFLTKSVNVVGGTLK